MIPSETTTRGLPIPSPQMETAVVAAFAAARTAQRLWAARPLPERLTVLRRFRGLLARQAIPLAATVQQSVAETLTAQLVPLADACRFIERTAASVLRPRRLGLSNRPVWLWGIRSEIRREPLGLVLILTPSNYPLFLPGVQVLQALAMGNAVVLKPSPEGQSAAVALAELLTQAGLDPRLLGLLPVAIESVGAAIHRHPDKILLTGSAESGRAILKAAAGHLIPCTMELSGNDAVFVRSDAHLERVVEALLFGLRLNHGATCIAPRRVFAHRSIHAELECRLATALPSVPPIPVAERQRERLVPLVLAARARGAILLGADRIGEDLSWGPVIVSRANPGMRLMHEDVFAPVLSVMAVDDDAGALRAAAQCPYALGASIFTRDEEAGRDLAHQVSAGVVTLNDLIVPTADPRTPFGGRGASGFGLTRGREGMEELTRVKVVAVRRGRWMPHLEPAREGDEELFAASLEMTHGTRLSHRWKALLRLVRAASRRRHQPLARQHSITP